MSADTSTIVAATVKATDRTNMSTDVPICDDASLLTATSELSLEVHTTTSTEKPIINGELCTFYAAGRCNKGDDCCYAHIDDPCDAFGFDGNCPDGNACTLQHIEFPICHTSFVQDLKPEDECNERTKLNTYCENCRRRFHAKKFANAPSGNNRSNIRGRGRGGHTSYRSSNATGGGHDGNWSLSRESTDRFQDAHVSYRNGSTRVPSRDDTRSRSIQNSPPMDGLHPNGGFQRRGGFGRRDRYDAVTRSSVSSDEVGMWRQTAVSNPSSSPASSASKTSVLTRTVASPSRYKGSISPSPVMRPVSSTTTTTVNAIAQNRFTALRWGDISDSE